MSEAVRTRPNRLTLTLGLALAVVVALTVFADDTADAGGEVPLADGIDLVYIAVGNNFPDSLGVGPGAGVNGAPILIVPTDPPLPTPIENELLRLDPRNVIIVGGTAVVSTAMQDVIEALLPNAVVDRIAGDNRYETNAQFSESVYPIETWISIGAPSFGGDEPDTDDVLTSEYFANNASDGSLFAAVDVPHGAEILTLKARVHDSADFGFVLVELNRVEYVTSPPEQIASISSDSNEGPITLSTSAIHPDYAIVDNENYAYTVRVSGVNSVPATDLYLTSVHIQYRLGSP